MPNNIKTIKLSFIGKPGGGGAAAGGGGPCLAIAVKPINKKAIREYLFGVNFMRVKVKKKNY
jgi:hypothetical protein